MTSTEFWDFLTSSPSSSAKEFTDCPQIWGTSPLLFGRHRWKPQKLSKPMAHPLTPVVIGYCNYHGTREKIVALSNKRPLGFTGTS